MALSLEAGSKEKEENGGMLDENGEEEAMIHVCMRFKYTVTVVEFQREDGKLVIYECHICMTVR